MKTVRFAALAVLIALIAFPLVGCATQSPTAAYHVDSQGNVSTATRSALNGSTAPGPQEIIGVYIPFPGTGIALKAGVEWDGNPVVITPPLSAQAAQTCAPAATAAPCAPQQTYTAPQQTYVAPRRTVSVPVPLTPHVAPAAGCP